MNLKTIHLTPPQLEPENIKENITCVRAHRERIFRTEIEKVGEKIIFHNYGQGGAGWTFLFGCVHESLRQFDVFLQENPAFKNKPICIIGAGCYGLLTALLLAHKGFEVKIVTEKFTDLSSEKAAGFFFPRPRKSSTAHERAIFLEHGLESYKNYMAIAQGQHNLFTHGAKKVPAYFGLDINPEYEPYIEQKLIDAPQHVIIDFGKNQYEAMAYEVLFIDTQALMQQLQNQIKNLGISVTEKKVENFEEVTEHIIFNCSALGAKKLAHDARLIPVQGHLISLKNQTDVNRLQYMLNFKVVQQSVKGTPRDELMYFAPKQDGILGITFLRGQDGTSKNQHEFERLIERCRKFFFI